ncbi:MAG: hypothetical protein JNL90_06815 [Planctomycetes bacterium]|nr:hypothetical protein [Planctomycetota bacterium]
MAMERVASDGGGRGSWLPFAVGLLIGGAAVWLARDGARGREESPELQRALVAALDRLAAAEARLAPAAAPPSPQGAQDGAAARPLLGRDGAAGGTSLAGKPVDEGSAVARRRTGVDESTMARAIERADRMSAALGAIAPAPLVISEASETPESDPPSAPVAPAPTTEAERERAAEERAAAVLVAFNGLLDDAGVDGWRLIAATVDEDGHRLTDVVLAERGARGTAIGSLIAESLKLERDPITGIAALLAEGAHGVERGVEVAYEGERYRIEVPGVLPVDLVPAPLRSLFALGGEAADAARVTNGDSAVALINRALALEKGVVLRVRSAGELQDGALTKAIVDLAFDSSGNATQTVLADLAWFEVDLGNRYAELCCEGGEMVEEGLKRPLFRGRLRVPLRDLTPEHWKGVPAVRRATGS